ncbi:MAG: hypothetical protein F2590_04220 [Actinobacteria bacterium]|uniref:Unannotated protein n=1 Tax=freshwater metagenome TaxID=449393 RepID=A0A6J6HXS9_9ZZZZ|nr:hypothetical protein [Actinomycetota bacterium]
MSDQDRSRNHRDRKPKLDAPERPSWQQRVDRPASADKPKSPLIPHEIQPEDLDMGVRVQLKTLSAENAEMTARHLAMVAYLAEQDPELAHRHAQAAASRAGRIPVVRETVGITAYFVEDWALSLRELLAHRRMTNSNDHVPMMIDCERGLGRPQRGLELGRTIDRAALSAEVRVSLAIAMSGARLDLGQNETGLVELEIKELNPNSVFDYSPRLFWAYADTLEVLGREADAAKWADLAARADKAIAQKNASEFEELSVLEEIEIPKASDFVRRERSDDDRPRRSFGSDRPTRDGDRPRRDGDSSRPTGDRPARDSDRPRRDGDRPQRSFGAPKRDGDRPARDSDRPRRDGDRPQRSFSSDRPRRDSDRPNRDTAPRKYSEPRADSTPVASDAPASSDAPKKPQLDFGDSPADRKPRGDKKDGKRGR